MSKQTHEESRTKISVFLEEETHLRAKDLAAREKKSLSQFVADLVEKRLKAQKAA
jgi:predicted HicB family RNase H-like nuclease